MVKKVHVIEDNEKNMNLFLAILKTIPGIEVHADMRGDTGLAMIKDGEPDLVILDVQLPGLSGTEICKELRKMSQFKEIPIIAVTAFTMKGDQENIMAAGFDLYVSKPIRVTEFKNTVEGFLNKKA